ncbi:MAG TPA: hypothetical protein VGE76_04930 [Opitutaceae bacterium]
MPASPQQTDPLPPRIVGGMFGLELGGGGGELPPFLRGPQRRLATARGALTCLVRTLQPRAVWLPSYLCPVVVPCCGGRERYFPIDGHLAVENHDWLPAVEKGDLVVFVDYFGFRAWDETAAQVRARGGWVVEDASQAALNREFSPQADYVITSPRKFAGVPDGSTLLALRGPLPEMDLPAAPAGWWFDAFRASALRRAFDLGSAERSWFDLFRRTEADGPVEPVRMSELAETLLLHGVDWAAHAAQRRANFLLLARELADLALFTTLPEHVVPLGFPVRLSPREPVRQALFAENIFPPIHWSLAPVVPAAFAASHRLSQEILTLPIDQRCSTSDLERMVRCIRSAR